MRTVTYRLADLEKKVSIHIGRLGENEVTRVQIDAGSLFAEYPDAVASMSVENPEGVKYPATVTRDGDMVIWDVRDSDLAKAGHGEIQWTFTENGAILKSAIARTSIGRSIVGDGEAPDPITDWIERAEDVLEQVDGAFPKGGSAGQVLAKKSGADYDTEWVDQGSGGTGDYEELENLPQIGGVELKGDKSLHDLGAAAETDIPDVSGFYTKPGSGIPASDLADGVIPDVSGFYTKPGSGIPASDLADGVIPDVSGFYTKPSGGIPASDIADGVIPDPEDLIDDTAGSGDTEKVWSADKSSSLLSAITPLTPSASASDVGKFLKAKTVSGGKVTEYEFGEAGGGDAVIDDTAGAGDTDKCWSADKTITEIQQIIVSGGVPIDDTAGQGDIDKIWSANKCYEMKSSFDLFTSEVPSKNLYDKNTSNPQDGKVYKANLSGLQDSSSYAVTGKMPVDGNTQYIFHAGEVNVKYVVYFSGESGQTPISEVQISGSAFTTPANCTYVDFELFAAAHTTEQYNAAIDAAMLEKGSTPSPYEPYGSNSYTFALPAEASDEGKALTAKTVTNGKVVEWEYVSNAIEVDNEFSESSENPIQNKVVAYFVDDITEQSISPNLYDKNTSNPQDGKVYKSTGTQLQDNSSYAVTGKIAVSENTQYIFTAGTATIKYVVFLSGESGGTRISENTYDGAFTTPANCTFVDFELFAASHTTEDYNAAIDAAMLVEGDTLPEEYHPYGKISYTIPAEKVEGGYAIEGAANVVTKASLINLYDKTLAQDKKVFNTNKVVDNVNYAFSGLIPVEPNAQYCFSIQKGLEYGYISSYYQRWDSSKTFIDEVAGSQATTFLNQIQTTATTAYISFCIYFGAAHTTEAFEDAIDTVMVVEGCQQPAEYAPYNLEPVVDHAKLDTMYRDNADRFKGKKWLALGTSVTYQDSKYYTEGVAEGEVVRGYVGDVARRKPMIVTNSGISGSTLGDNDGASSSLINRYQNFTYTDYYFVTLEYGINDFGNDIPVGAASDAAGTDTFAACLKTIIEYALNQNPIVGLIICTDPDVRGTTTNQNGNTLKDYADVMLEIAKQYRLPVCDWFYHSGINSITKGDGTSRYFLTQSGTHPSVYGHMRMGAMLNQVFDSLLC